MSKNLVLVESPSKAKTINKYLGRNYKVEATVGHIRNLPKTKLGVDIDNNFEPKLLNIRGKGDLIKQIRDRAKKSDKIFIATDPDREGEAIAQDIVDVIKGKTKAQIFRVLFNEITKDSVKKAMKSPKVLDDHLVTSQRARRVMDRIIGYQISPLLWRAIIDEAGNSLSAGRVQSVSLRLICEREVEIENFIATEYWSIIATFKTDDNKIFESKLYSVDSKAIKVLPKPEMEKKDWDEFLKKNFALNNKKIVDEIVEKIKAVEQFSITDIKKKEVRRNPAPPFITSTLQAEASRRLGFRPRKTMRVAQSLYEGVEIGEKGFSGLITYMRTDSTRINNDIALSAKELIENSYGDRYSLTKPNLYGSSKNQNIQDAHEAIRPTSIEFSPERMKNYLNEDQNKLYELIWKRFIASQMQPAIHETTTINIDGDEFTFRTSGTAVKFDGYQRVFEESKEDSDNDNNENAKIPVGLKKNQKLDIKDLNENQHFTKPPARYSESSLIKELESNGIGRPSTYALIIGTLLDRAYINSENRKLVPTELGKKVNRVLVDNFDSIFNVNYTARMENELDQIANGDEQYVKVMNEFYDPFSQAIEKAESKIEKVKCEKCGSDMDIKIGRFGKFLACTNYPDCKNIKSLRETKNENSEPEFTGEECPKCGSKTIYRNSRYGRFIGCENYPDCDFTKQITLDIKCPKCKDGDVIPRRSKRGKTFYGCSKYPDCDFISWTIPKKEESEKKE